MRTRLAAFTSFALALLAATSMLGQSTRPAPAFESVDIRLAPSGDSVSTLGILPNGHVYFRNTSLRQIIAAAYNLDQDLITGGPEWLDSERLDIEARSAATATPAERLLMLQALLAERFKLAIRHDPKPLPVYVLSVGKSGPSLQPAANPGSPNWERTNGEPRQLHVLCKGYNMAKLAELLLQIAPGYWNFP